MPCLYFLKNTHENWTFTLWHRCFYWDLEKKITTTPPHAWPHRRRCCGNGTSCSWTATWGTAGSISGPPNRRPWPITCRHIVYESFKRTAHQILKKIDVIYNTNCTGSEQKSARRKKGGNFSDPCALRRKKKTVISVVLGNVGIKLWWSDPNKPKAIACKREETKYTTRHSTIE